MQIANDGRSIEDLSNVKRFGVSDVLISPVRQGLKELGNWQVDGELVHGSEMKIRVHRQVLNLFASGIQCDKVEECIPKKKETKFGKFCPCFRRKKDKSQAKPV